ncbi:Copia protein [Symbiodinium microadriaticum]|uniref:Copia protein n=1 Tax=Symbiodinium microadriaticum TaxID=2951 RepID=A0A1Q9EPV2_SYMMI|nr:Copia protein [Symbiodinium microadriaticum]CAE7891856.1 RE1 [Symbiodinium microadriaticum]CAE7921353.1 RE1 [Symbiodinium sp. KB8]
MEKGLVPGTVNGRHVSRGHLKLREDGGLVIAKGVKFNVQETNKGLLDLLPPTTAEGVEFQEEDAKPQSKKELAEEIEFTSRYLLSEENYSLEEVIKLYNKLEELGDTDLRIGKKTAVTSWYTGAFVHGGCAGLRKNIMKYPHTTKYLVQVGKKYANGMKFTALGLARNATLGMHRDVHNYKNSENMVLPLTSFTGGSLWTLGPDVDEENAVYKTLPNGDKAKGKMIELTTRAATKLSQEDVEKLEHVGFSLDPEALNLEGDEEPDELEVEDQEEVKISSLGVNEVSEVWKSEMKTFSLVKETNEDSAMKEFKNLRDTKGQEGMDLFAAGLDTTTLRTMIAYTIGKPWAYGTTDIRQACVLAPWLGQAVALQPPAIAYELGLAEPGDYWLVRMSIYGLRELWSRYRDEQLTAARWTAVIDGQEEQLKLVQMITDDQVWKIVRTSGNQEPLGYIIVYVDDLLINALPSAMSSFYVWLAAQWECDNLNVLTEDHSIRFLGMEMHMVKGGVELAQEGFVRELLRAHGHDGSRARTQGPKETMVLISAAPVDLEGKEDKVKMAQRRVGELLWLAGRTRPDIQYITRCPEMVNQVGKRMLDYLNETLHYRVSFELSQEPEALRVFTDSSFAPSSGRSHGAAAVFVNDNPVSWRSSKQQFVTLSTAKSELLEAVEGAVLANATCGLLEELRGDQWIIYLHIDNQSALMLLQGLTQRADLGTKPFTKERYVDRQPRRLTFKLKFRGVLARKGNTATGFEGKIELWSVDKD